MTREEARKRADELIDKFNKLNSGIDGIDGWFNNRHDDEWLQLEEEMCEFTLKDIPDDIRHEFEPLGYGERVAMICDGIERERKSVCRKCKTFRIENYKFCCDAFPDEIDNSIFYADDTVCMYFEEREKGDE